VDRIGLALIVALLAGAGGVSAHVWARRCDRRRDRLRAAAPEPKAESVHGDGVSARPVLFAENAIVAGEIAACAITAARLSASRQEDDRDAIIRALQAAGRRLARERDALRAHVGPFAAAQLLKPRPAPGSTEAVQDAMEAPAQPAITPSPEPPPSEPPQQEPPA
jgi:hypothetical protein